MKILLIPEQYPPTYGGVGTSARRIATHISLAGAHVRVFTFDDSKPPSAHSYVINDADPLVAVRRIGPFFLEQNAEELAWIREKHRAALRRQWFDKALGLLADDPPDCVFSFFLLNAGLLGQLIGSTLGIPVIACARGNDIGESIFRPDRLSLLEWIASRADAIVCVNQHLRRRLLCACPEMAAKTRVIANSTERLTRPEGTLDVRARADWPAGALVVAFVGTMRQKKGAGILLASLESLTDIDVRLLVVGPEMDPMDRPLFGQSWDRLLEQNRLFVSGLESHGGIVPWLANADLVVMPSVDDGMANGVLEAMALGICPLATDVFADVITHGVEGVLVGRDDPAALAAAIRELAAAPQRRLLLGIQARARSEAWTPEKEAQGYLDLAAEVLANARTSPPREQTRSTGC